MKFKAFLLTVLLLTLSIVGQAQILSPPHLPYYIQSVSGSATATSVAVTLPGTPVVGDTMLVFIAATTRGANSITQTNVAYTQKITTNGNSQFSELWIGTISGSAGTGVTAAFTGSAASYVQAVEVNKLFTTVGTPTTGTGVTGTSSEALVIGSLTTSFNDYVVAGFSVSGGQGGIGASGTQGFWLDISSPNSQFVGRMSGNFFQPVKLMTGTSALNWSAFYAVIK